MASSPFRPGASVEEQLAYYKAQYEQLEQELHEFQASSKDLEAELERDVEESEKRERKLKEQVESLGFEVEEWKTKSRQTREEANRAQTVLQKEITTMRDTNRTLQLKLRDIEVANDDYEMQARHTTSSLEDMESKYSIAIERGVMLEEEIKSSEKEREQLRIDAQRLRDELSDLRVESEITVEKLRHTEAALENSRARKLPLHAHPARPRSPTSEISAVTPPSPGISTPPATKSETSGSEIPTPPSPPLSDTTGTNKALPRTPMPMVGKSLLGVEGGTTPRPVKMPSRMPRHSRGPSLSGTAPGAGLGTSRMGPPRPRPAVNQSESLPRSSSLYQIKGLIGRMQKIEERVHSVRSKLPPSKVPTPTKNSPRGQSPAAAMPASVTMRSGRKRPSNMSSLSERAGHPTEPISRLSFGVPATTNDRPGSSASRPNSRASNTSNSEHPNPFVRPSSRISMGGSRTPLGHYPMAPASRPRSSIGGNYNATTTPLPRTTTSSTLAEAREAEVSTPTPRRTTLDRTGIPTPGLGHRRQSSGVVKRASQQFGTGGGGGGSMAPPLPPSKGRRVGGIGETY